MFKYIFSAIFIISFVAMSTLPTFAVENQKEHVHHWELMTNDEMDQHRKIMRGLDTREARQAYRKQHHELMRSRAKEQGVELMAGCRHNKNSSPSGKHSKRN